MKNENQIFVNLLNELFDIDGLVGQIFIATHSPNILLNNYKQFIRIYHSTGQEIEIISGSNLMLDDTLYKHLLRSFLYLKEAMFSRCIVFVEGDTENGAMPVFAKRMNFDFDEKGIGVVKLDGADSVENCMKLYNEFKIKAIAIIDKDKKDKYAHMADVFFTKGDDFEEDVYDNFTLMDYMKYNNCIGKISAFVRILRPYGIVLNVSSYIADPERFTIDDTLQQQIIHDIKSNELVELRKTKNASKAYNGLLVSAIRLLRKRQVSSFYKEYYQMVIIDEFQDTNMLGYWLVNKLIGDNTVIFLGDDIQKIYGFLGAINGIFEKYKEKYPIKEIKFCNNYRFRTNDSMKELDKLIRSYGNSYAPSEFTASINLKQLSNDTEEDNFIVEGIEKIIANSNDKVAVLVRAGNQGESIAVKLKRKGIVYFNALFRDTDVEFLKFYEVAIDEFHNATGGSGKALQRDLQSCLEAVSQRQNEIYSNDRRKFVYDAMYKLLEVLFEESKKWEGTSKDRYENIDFILGGKGLKHMMEYIEEKVVLTTIHGCG